MKDARDVLLVVTATCYRAWCDMDGVVHVAWYTGSNAYLNLFTACEPLHWRAVTKGRIVIGAAITCARCVAMHRD